MRYKKVTHFYYTLMRIICQLFYKKREDKMKIAVSPEVLEYSDKSMRKNMPLAWQKLQTRKKS